MSAPQGADISCIEVNGSGDHFSQLGELLPDLFGNVNVAVSRRPSSIKRSEGYESLSGLYALLKTRRSPIPYVYNPLYIFLPSDEDMRVILK